MNAVDIDQNKELTKKKRDHLLIQIAQALK